MELRYPRNSPPPPPGKNAFRPAAILRADGRADPLWQLCISLNVYPVFWGKRRSKNV